MVSRQQKIYESRTVWKVGGGGWGWGGGGGVYLVFLMQKTV